MENMRLYGLIEKVEPQDDGTIKVHGIVSTEDEDDQGEIVRAAAMREAIPSYMQFPALREMHGLSAAGTALECNCGDDGITRIVGHVVDPIAVKKIKNNVYRGFSIGGRVRERESGNYKVITKLDLHEISLVDRPANPEAVFDMWKASQETTMPDGLGNLGDALAEAMAKTQQYWACGDPTHQHAKKDEAARCLAKAAVDRGATPLEVIAAAEMVKAVKPDDKEPDEDDAAKADAKPTRDVASEQNFDGDNDADDHGAKETDQDKKDDFADKGAADPMAFKADGGDGDAKKPYGDVTYADPGYRGGKKRYPVDTEGHVRAAWSYINMPKNAKKYTSEQLASIKSKIRAAAKKHGIEISQKVADFADENEIAAMAAELVASVEMLGDLVLEKAGRRQSAADHFLMNVAHDAIGKLADGQWCMKAEANATQDTGRNTEHPAPTVSPPAETYQPGHNSTQDTSKRGARHSGATMGYLKAAHDAMCKAGAFCHGASDMSKASTTEDSAMGASTIEKTPGAGTSDKEAKKLRKMLKRSEANNAELKDMVKTLAARVEDIAKQPLPAKAGGVLPPDVVSVSKSQDGKAVDHAATVEKGEAPPSEAEVMNFWKGLTSEEKFRYSLAASRDRPYVPIR
jgi:hypothetical protein